MPFLIEGVNQQMDAGGKKALSDRKDLEVLWKTPKWQISILKIKLFHKWINKQLLYRLSISQDAAINFINAQEKCATLLNSIARNESLPLDKLTLLEEEINSNKMQAQVYLRNLRKNHTPLFGAISTEQAIRSILHYEDKTIDRLLKKGRIDLVEAEKMRASLQERWKLLINKPPKIE